MMKPQDLPIFNAVTASFGEVEVISIVDTRQIKGASDVSRPRGDVDNSVQTPVDNPEWRRTLAKIRLLSRDGIDAATDFLDEIDEREAIMWESGVVFEADSDQMRQAMLILSLNKG